MSDKTTPPRGYKGSTTAGKKTVAKRPVQKKIEKKTAIDTSSKKFISAEDHSKLIHDSLQLFLELKKNVDADIQVNNFEKSSKFVQKKINTFLRKNRIHIFGKVGETYDPAFHEALLFIKNNETKKNKILEIRSPGLKSGKKVLIRCKAIISK